MTRIDFSSAGISTEQRRKNVRLAWVLAGFALFMLLSSVPFWKGMFNMVMGGAQ